MLSNPRSTRSLRGFPNPFLNYTEQMPEIRVSDKARKRAEELNVDPIEYRRWERGEKVTSVSDAIDREAFNQERAIRSP